MKKYILIIIGFVLNSFVLFGQNNCNSSSCNGLQQLNLSTGYNQTTGTLINAGNFDDDWVLTAVPLPAVPNVTVPRPATIVVPNAAWGNDTSSNYISGVGTNRWGQSQSTISRTDCSIQPGTVPITFEKRFCLCENTDLSFNFNIWADNYARVTFVDGLATSTVIYDQQNSITSPLFCNTGLSFDGTPEVCAVVVSNAASGQCRLILELFDSSADSTGVQLQGTVSGNLNSINCCFSNEIISGRKIDDVNCNGVIDNGELGIQNWSFELINTSNIVVSTVNSDINGYFSFGYQPTGVYRIREIQQTGWTLTEPNSLTQTITLSAGNPIYLEFLNCKNPPIPPFPDCCEYPLEITSNYENQDLPIIETTMVDGNSISIAGELFTFNSDATIPITEVRAVVTDLDYNYDLEACAECIDNPALWGSIMGDSDPIGSSPNALKRDPAPLPWFGDWNNLYNNNINNREIIWKSDNGEMIKSGDDFQVNYMLPPASEIPCCATSVKICLEISYKDANCKVCTEQVCSSINLTSTADEVGSLEIDVEKKKDCCERTLTAETDVPASYKWSTGASSKDITVTENGTYTVTATSGGASISKTVVVNDILTGDFPLLSFNSLFHPDFVDLYLEPKCNCTEYAYVFPKKKKIRLWCKKWSSCWVQGKKNKLYIMDVSPGKEKRGIANSYNANEYKLEIWHRWNNNSGQGVPLKTITGISENCTPGFNNWDIFWDGTNENGFSLKNEKSDSYVWRLTLKNCEKESSKLTYKTTFNPNCGPCVKWKKFLGITWCAENEGCWKIETFEFGDVQMTK